MSKNKKKIDVFELKGLDKLKYIVTTKPEKIRADVKKELEKRILSYAAYQCVERGILPAINALNIDIFVNAMKAIDLDVEFLKQYFVNEVKAKEEKGETEQSKMTNLKHMCYYLLHGGSSKRLINLIKHSNDELFVTRFLDVLMNHRLKNLFEKNKLHFFNRPLIRENGWQLREKPKIMQELRFINKELKRMLQTHKVSSKINAELIDNIGILGVEKSDFFVKLLLTCEDKEELDAAVTSFWRVSDYAFKHSNEFASLIKSLMRHCASLNDWESRSVLHKLIEEIIKKCIIDSGEFSMKISPILKQYGDFLTAATKRGETTINVLRTELRKIFDERTCIEILLNVFEKANDYGVKDNALAQLTSIMADTKRLGGNLSIQLKKTGLPQSNLKKLGIYSYYVDSINRALYSPFTLRAENDWPLVSLFSICPSYSLSQLKIAIIKIQRRFSKLDATRDKELSEIKSYFRKIFSPTISPSEKKTIIEIMEQKQFIGKEWRNVKTALHELQWLQKAVITHEMPPKYLDGKLGSVN